MKKLNRYTTYNELLVAIITNYERFYFNKINLNGKSTFYLTS